MFPGCHRGCERGWVRLHKAPVPRDISADELDGWVLAYQERCLILGDDCPVRRCACDGQEVDDGDVEGDNNFLEGFE